MNAKGTDGQINRWAEAQQIAATWLRYLDADECALIVFSSDVRCFPEDGSFARLRGEHSDERRRQLLKSLEKIEPRGWTNTLGRCGKPTSTQMSTRSSCFPMAPHQRQPRPIRFWRRRRNLSIMSPAPRHSDQHDWFGQLLRAGAVHIPDHGRQNHRRCFPRSLMRSLMRARGLPILPCNCQGLPNACPNAQAVERRPPSRHGRRTKDCATVKGLANGRWVLSRIFLVTSSATGADATASSTLPGCFVSASSMRALSAVMAITEGEAQFWSPAEMFRLPAIVGGISPRVAGGVSVVSAICGIRIGGTVGWIVGAIRSAIAIVAARISVPRIVRPIIPSVIGTIVGHVAASIPLHRQAGRRRSGRTARRMQR